MVEADNGGTDNGGADTSPEQTFTITLGEVNDAAVRVAGSVADRGNVRVRP